MRERPNRGVSAPTVWAGQNSTSTPSTIDAAPKTTGTIQALAHLGESRPIRRGPLPEPGASPGSTIRPLSGSLIPGSLTRTGDATRGERRAPAMSLVTTAPTHG